MIIIATRFADYAPSPMLPSFSRRRHYYAADGRRHRRQH
jgi:hypothetical protein